jgi:cation diffusion facilitator family transporter
MGESDHDHERSRRHGPTKFLPRRFRHDHDHAHRVDTDLTSSGRGIRAVKISLLGLGLTAAIQVAVVAVSGSVALLGDTLHNFADGLTALPLWIAFVIGRRRPTRSYTYGYGRAEDVAGVFIVLVVAVSAAVAGTEAVRRLIEPHEIRNIGLVVAASLVGFAGNELVASYRIRIGRDIGSAALVADGLHARVDGVTSLGVLAGAIGVWLGYPVADPIVGLLITVAILAILKNAARDVYRRLMDAVDPDLVDAIETVLAGTEGVKEVGDVRVRWIGHRLRAEVAIAVDSELSIVEGHDVAVRAHHQLLHDIDRLDSALVHVDPAADDGRDHHEDLAHHFDRIRRTDT